MTDERDKMEHISVGRRTTIIRGHAVDPLIRELFERLPPKGAEWSTQQAAAWLRACAAIFDVVYGREGDIEIRITESGDETFA